jgi:leader peptidase (prepilin peptidase)/N-methyltransferase
MPYSLSGNGLFYSDPIYTGLLSFFIFCVGVCMGSFASAISYRTIRRESWIVSHSCYSAARSRCPQCDHPLGVLDLIPVLSWIFLGGSAVIVGNPFPVFILRLNFYPPSSSWPIFCLSDISRRLLKMFCLLCFYRFLSLLSVLFFKRFMTDLLLYGLWVYYLLAE